MNLSDTWDANIIVLGEGLYNAVKKKPMLLWTHLMFLA